MRKKKLSNLIWIVFLAAGLALLLYPKLSNYWNSLHQTKIVNQYIDDVGTMDKAEYDRAVRDVEDYNRSLLERDNPFILTDAQAAAYPGLLNVSGNGVMGYVEIPSIGVSLPIYHGTSHATLQRAVGHIDWTSLPSDKDGTHCVLSGHRGLPSSKLFTDLDKLVVGDRFAVRVLNETLTYTVDQIRIVEPEDTLSLTIDPDRNYCTLVTCTPYGINTHRLMVRGQRVLGQGIPETRVGADALVLDQEATVPLFAVPWLAAGLIWLAVDTHVKNKQNQVRTKLGLQERISER